MKSVVENICKLPETFQKVRDKSMWTLVNEYVTVESFKNINIKKIEEFLKQNEYLVDFWLISSDDKRVDKGHYFIIKHGIPEVGYYASGSGISDVQTFSNKFEACADFILKEVKSILEIDRIYFKK